MYQALGRVFAGESVEIPVLRYPRTEGRDLWLRAFAYPVRGADGRLKEVVLVQEDASARKTGRRPSRWRPAAAMT